MEHMVLDGDGDPGDAPHGAHADSISTDPQGAMAEPPPAPSSATTSTSISGPSPAPAGAPASAEVHHSTSASIFGPSAPTSAEDHATTSAPTVENNGESSSSMLPVAPEEPSSQQPQDLNTALLAAYAPSSAPTSVQPPTAESTLQFAPTIEKDGDGYYSSTVSDVLLEEAPALHPQLPASVPAFGLNPLGPSDPDPGFLDNARHNHAESDSAYDTDSFIDDTTSMNSEVTQYRMEHGRRYHGYKDGAYWGPNDEQANDVQDLASHMYYLTLDSKLHLAPLVEPHNILDVGTGTGIWAMDMADQYPSAVVTGVDLSPTQPAFVPVNCVFEVDDITQTWTYPPGHFDFVHIREMFGSIPDWDGFLQEAYRCTKPGGWVEVVEHAVEAYSDDGTMPADHFYHEWTGVLMDCARKMGKSWDIWKEAKERMLRAGFVDVVEVPFRWPMNGWPTDAKLKKIGRFNQYRLNDGCEGFVLRMLISVAGWSYEKAQLFVMQFRKHIRDFSCHVYQPGNVVYGRRPPERHGR